MAPNWIGIGVFGLLGLLNPGFWLLGAGLEAGYLFALANSSRFRKVVDAGGDGSSSEPSEAARIAALRDALPPQDGQRYRDFIAKCRRTAHFLPDNAALHDTLAHVSWLFLQLLHSRLTVSRLLAAASAEEQAEGTLASRLAKLEQRLSATDLHPDLRRSLEATRGIMRERLQAHSDTAAKLGYIDAELSRLEEQISLLHDRAQLDRDAPALSGSIERVSAGITGATQWMSREKQLLGDLRGSFDIPPSTAIYETGN
ncbi:MAG: hypothetical protein EOP86_16260 [Verrucomicrobiaceae bacterium]|nr:MAG: hypothetical protein EOP86_16260 [Verrucomicrobiaceae bacterium]